MRHFHHMDMASMDMVTQCNRYGQKLGFTYNPWHHRHLHMKVNSSYKVDVMPKMSEQRNIKIFAQ